MYMARWLLTTLCGKLANWRAAWLTQWTIRWFVRRYGVNLHEAEPLTHYPSFNAFFTRALRHPRPLATSDWICPVDGTISQLGKIAHNSLVQAKGQHYSLEALLGGNSSLAPAFHDGSFACFYLSPKDYHRVHMPCAATLQSMLYIPGRLLSVNPKVALRVPNLFAHNERVVCTFLSEQHGYFAMVLVGAMIVGSMATVWHDAPHGIVNAPRHVMRSWDYATQHISLQQGDEMGRFLLGSTVILLCQADAMMFNPSWQTGTPVRFGEYMA